MSETLYLCKGFFDPQLVASRVDELAPLLASMDKVSSDDIESGRRKLMRASLTEHVQTVTTLWMAKYATENPRRFGYELPTHTLSQREVAQRIENICEFIADNLPGGIVILMHNGCIAPLMPTGSTFRRLHESGGKIGVFFGEDDDRLADQKPEKNWWGIAVEGPKLCLFLGGVDDTYNRLSSLKR